MNIPISAHIMGIRNERMSEQYFNKIYVIESLPEKERHTGKELFDDLLRWKAGEIEYLDVVYINLKSKNDFLDSLADIAVEVETDDVWPIIHLEMHGNNTGLGVASGEFIPWEDLREALTKINVALKINLLVVLAACEGAYLTLLLKAPFRAPVWGLVGPVTNVTVRDIVVGFQEFYSVLLNTLDGIEAVRKLNDSIPNVPHKYDFVHCLGMFKDAYRQHLVEGYTKESLSARTERMTDKARGVPKWAGVTRRKLKRMFRKELLKGRKPYFLKFREMFFMYDLYPENKIRFQITYQEVAAQDN